MNLRMQADFFAIIDERFSLDDDVIDEDGVDPDTTAGFSSEPPRWTISISKFVRITDVTNTSVEKRRCKYFGEVQFSMSCTE